MIASKHINKIAIIAVVAAIIFCIVAIAFAPKLIEKFGTGVRMEYETKMFDTSEPMKIDIQMDPEQWETMLDKATQELYYVCDVVINGTKFYDVGIRPKGNTSLSSIASNPNTDRFSFKLEFDQFIEGQTAWGLDKLCLNNNYADATNMKEALFYDMFEFLGADASLYNYAEITVNGEYWGIYLALEAVEDSFLIRNYGAQNGELYKPDTMGISRGGDWRMGNNDDSNWLGDLISDIFGGDEEDEASGEMDWWGRDEDDNDDASGEAESSSSGRSRRNSSDEPEATTAPDPMPPSGELSESMRSIVDADESDNSDESASDDSSDESDSSGDASGESGWRWGDREDDEDRDWGWGDDNDGGGFGGMFGGSGANLNYNGDDLDNYSTIWLSEVTTTDEADHKRVVEALKNVSERENLEESMDIDNLVRFMAVHNFSVNWDSLSGSMAHNYYLYESDGQLNIIPWDYNLAFGSMGSGGNAKSAVNDPIDDSWASTSFFDPILENEEYLEMYHEYYQKLVDEYIFGGRFDEFYERTRSQIDDLVATDPNALYDYDEYDAAAETLYHLVLLRGESIRGQLNGTIPSTSSGQRQDDSNLVDATDINLSLMGGMSMGGSFGGGGGWGEEGNPFRRSRDNNDADEDSSGESSSGEEGSDEASEEASDEQTGDASDEVVATSATAQNDTSSGEAAVERSSDVSDEQNDDASDEANDDASDEANDDASDEANDDASDEANDEASDEANDEASGESEERSSRSSGWGSSSREMNRQNNMKKLWLLGACAAVLVIGIVVAAVFKKKG